MWIIEGGRAQQSASLIFGIELNFAQVVGTIEHPHVVVLIHGQPCDAAHLPFVRQRLGPVRIELILWRGWRLRAQSSTKNRYGQTNP